MSGGDGIIEICGSSIGGALSVTGQNGDININNCDATDLTGGVVIELSDSAVTIRGTNLQDSDIGILQNTGAVTLDQLQQVSDLNLEKNNGTLSIIDMTTTSDWITIEHMGDILMSNL